MSIFFHRFSWKNKKENVSRDAHFLCFHKAHSHNAAPSVDILGIKIPEEVLAMLLEASLLGTGNGHFMSQKPKATRLQKSSLRIQPNPASTSPRKSGGSSRQSASCSYQRPSPQNTPSSQAVVPPQGACRPSAPRLSRNKSHSVFTAGF